MSIIIIIIIILMGWVMQELIYSLNYVLEHMDLMRNWVRHKGREGKCMCNLCSEDWEVWVTLCGIAPFV